MKRKFFRASWMLAIAGLVAFSFVGTSCGSDDDEEEEKPIQVEKFKVTYDSDGGSEVAAADVVKGKEANLTNKPTKSGFTFKGWSKVKGDASQIVTSLKVEADVTLYAIWEEGEAPQPDPSKNHFIVVKASDMADHEWDTQFWFSTPTTFNAGDSWEVSISVKALHSTGDKAIGTQSHIGKAGDYKHWAAIGSVPFTEEWVTYTQSGEFTADQQDCDFVAFNLNDYNPANTYCFDNISFKINGQEQIKNGDIEGDDFKQFWIKEYPDAGEPVANVSAANVIADGDPIPGSAVTVEKVKISFDFDGGEGTQEAIEVTKGKEGKIDDLKAAKPSKEGFIFKGWATEKGGAVVTEYKAEGDITLYAVWEERPAPTGDNGVIEIDCGEAGANAWDKQIEYTLPVAFEKDKTYIVKLKVKATDPVEGEVFGLWPIWKASENRNEWGNSADVQYCASYAVSKDWEEFTWEIKANFPHDALPFVFGKVGGKIYIDDLFVAEKDSETNTAKNGSFDEDSTEGWAPVNVEFSRVME